MRRALSLAALALVAACGGGTSGPDAGADACTAAFQVAAGVDANADSVSDLYPVVRACGSVDAWTAAFEATDGAGFSGSATEVLRNVCTAPEVADETLCGLVE